MKVIVATLTAKEGERETLRNILVGLTEPSRAEPGNIRYDPCQLVEDPDTFLVVEEWKDQTAVEEHFETPHVNDAFKKLNSGILAEHPDIKVFEAS